METKHRKGDFLLNRERGGLIEWDPNSEEIPYVDFLFLTSAKKKAEGLARSWGTSSKFGNWSPSNPPAEPNELPLNELIKIKARKLTKVAVEELKAVYLLKKWQMPRLFLVTDTHPSLSKPGHAGEVHLVKPDIIPTLDNLVKYISKTWTRFQGPTDVQIASAYAMTDSKGRIITNRPMQDSVFIHYPENPLASDEDIHEYIVYLREERFPGYSDSRLVRHMSTIAGGVMNEVLYTYAYSKGNEGVISHALSSPYEPTTDSILGMGAAGLTPAIVGWIEMTARRTS